MDDPPMKKKKREFTEDPSDKKAVDGHVQAFLKAVLDHAQKHSGKKTKLLKTAATFKKDAWTQTDDSVVYQSDLIVLPTNPFVNDELGTYAQSSLYDYSLPKDLTVVNDKTQYFMNEPEYSTFEDSTKTNRVSSNKIKKAINTWVKNYESWFLQNFGMDIRTASIPINTDNTQATMEPNYSQYCIPPANEVNVQTTQTQHIVSNNAVSYIVSEGALCVPNSQFSPYYSLVPSFYAPPTDNTSAMINMPIDGSVNSLINPYVHNPNLIFNNVMSNILPQNITNLSPACVPNTTPVAIQSVPSIETIKNEISSVEQSIQLEQKNRSNEISADFQTSAMLAALALPILDSQNCHQWGPQLKYGTYGRLPSTEEKLLFDNIKASTVPITNTEVNKSESSDSETKKMPPPPPTFVLLKRQAMICALQLSARERGSELFIREKESSSGISVNFIEEFDQLCFTCVSMKPVYLCRRLSDLNLRERSYYFKCDESSLAFKILSHPCFLVGSIRCWDETEYLVLCLSPKAELVPILPPFISDPFELLEGDNDSGALVDDDEASAVVLNPKPMDDMWIYLANLTIEALDDQQYDFKILSQSAAFNQMTTVFEFEVNTNTGLFVCRVLIDNQICATAESASSIVSAHESAARQAIEWLRCTQPVVGLMSLLDDDDDDDDDGDLVWEGEVDTNNAEQIVALWGISERVLVNNLMWAKDELDMAIGFEQLEAHCDVPKFGKEEDDSFDFDQRFTCPKFLDHCLQSYAASALVTPLKLCSSTVPRRLWSEVRQSARRWGLLTCARGAQSSNDGTLMVCKQIPMYRIKRSLFDNKYYGCFTLLAKGSLSSQASKRLFLADPLCEASAVEELCATECPILPLPNDSTDIYADEPVTQLARRFIGSSHVKHEPVVNSTNVIGDDDSCILWSAELNQPSNAIEIIDDLPKTLIPGIDF